MYVERSVIRFGDRCQHLQRAVEVCVHVWWHVILPLRPSHNIPTDADIPVNKNKTNNDFKKPKWEKFLCCFPYLYSSTLPYIVVESGGQMFISRLAHSLFQGKFKPFPKNLAKTLRQ